MSESDFNVFDLWRKIENDLSSGNLLKCQEELLAETADREMTGMEISVSLFLKRKIV